MTETSIFSHATPSYEQPIQPYWLGSFLCLFVALTSFWGLLQLFGGVTYGVAYALLAGGIAFGLVGLRRPRVFAGLSIAGTALNLAGAIALTVCLIKGVQF